MNKLLTTLTTICISASFFIGIEKSFSQTIHSENKIQIPLYKMSKEDINKLLKNISQKTFVEKLEVISESAKGTPYFLGPLGEGSESNYDKNPLMDLSRVDCVTFIEQVLALSLSYDYDTAFKNLQKIRYKDADIKIEKRNHYFMADWAINNQWLFIDVSKEVGNNLTKPLTRTISHEKFFGGSVYKGIKAQEKDRTLTINYIPKDKLFLIENKLQSGDIAAFVIDLPNIFVSHTGFIIKDKNGKVFFRNATSIGPKQVTDLPYDQLVEYLKKSKKNMGLVFLRPSVK